jgi:hypothetical protein
MEFRQLAPHECRTVGAEGVSHVGEAIRDAVHRLVKDNRSRFLRQRRKPFPARGPLRGRKAFETEAVRREARG